MARPWLSVIMPTCDGGQYLAQALESVARQADDAVEVVIIDDGSRDDTLAIARNYQARLSLAVHALPRRGNWVANANHGMRLARGDYLCILHQDDAWRPGRLRRLRRLAALHPRAVIFVHPCWYMDSQGRKIGYWHCPFPRTATVIPARRALERLLVQCLYGVAAPLFSAARARDVGLMDESLWYAADWDFWLKLTRLGDTVYCPTPLAMFRLHAASQTIARGRHGDEIHRQQSLVLDRHIEAIADSSLAAEVSQVARFSIDVNAALVRWLDGRQVGGTGLPARLIALGPPGWLRFFRDSRVLERCLSRAQAGAIGWRPRAAQCSQESAAGTAPLRLETAAGPWKGRVPLAPSP